MKVGLRSWASVTACLTLVWSAIAVITAQQQSGAAIAIDNDDIGGVVTSTKGPEAGVWVIAKHASCRRASRRSSSPTTAAAT